MTGIVVPPRILAASATASVLTAVLIALVFTGDFAVRYGPTPTNLLLFLVAVVVGVPIALAVGTPVGFAITWLVWLTGPATYWRAAVAGAISGLVIALVAVAVAWPSGDDPWLAVGMPLAGTLTGLAAFRWHFRDPNAPA